MAIVGLTRKKDFQSERSLPRLAKLRKGAPKPESGKRPGEDLKYFRVDFAPQYTYLSESFHDIYGSEPKEFNNARLISETADGAFPTFYEAWTPTTMTHRCDGETQVLHWDNKTSKYSHDVIQCAGGDPDFKCGCSKIGRLSFVLPDFTYQTGEIGQFVIETHSTHDIIAIWNQLMFLEQQFGNLAGIPFTIGRMDKEVSYPKKDGTRGKMTRSLVYIKPDGQFMKQHFIGSFDAKSEYSLPAPQEDTPQLPAQSQPDDTADVYNIQAITEFMQHGLMNIRESDVANILHSINPDPDNNVAIIGTILEVYDEGHMETIEAHLKNLPTQNKDAIMAFIVGV